MIVELGTVLAGFVVGWPEAVAEVVSWEWVGSGCGEGVLGREKKVYRYPDCPVLLGWEGVKVSLDEAGGGLVDFCVRGERDDPVVGRREEVSEFRVRGCPMGDVDGQGGTFDCFSAEGEEVVRGRRVEDGDVGGRGVLEGVDC